MPDHKGRKPVNDPELQIMFLFIWGISEERHANYLTNKGIAIITKTSVNEKEDAQGTARKI